MTRRETRVINAFLRCIESGEFTEEYAIVLIEDTSKYGWLSNEAKDFFYNSLPAEEEPVVEEVIEEIPVEEIPTEVQ